MKPYVVVDIETTGTHPLNSDIIEIGAVYVEEGQVIKQFNQLVQPNQEISAYITGITGITNEMVQEAPPIEKVMPQFLDFCEGAFLVGHNIILFDYRMLKAKAALLKLPFEKDGVDTLTISRKMLSKLPSRKLGDLCAYYDIALENAHRAYDDAYATYELFEKLKKDFYEREPQLFKEVPMKWEVPKKIPLTPKQKKYLMSLCAKHGLEIDVDIEQLTKSECSRRIDQIICQYGKL
ncbi:DNA polymerase III subunit epsilon [Sporanaerobium hydrogeniformans]|uniref:DNA polymerase III subunit epsilon n=1 Tax=Sporanaerobium hydrogeniformans TaxID=3072179 RepID=A0AC61DGB7_9FIRM|nr:3'-5' exonuclease [Sporanaerobium hydrogeniformans]PHV72314.1 DNA polymerase III subunit epsilon [Sporanaerobium hydrogeniformans]